MNYGVALFVRIIIGTSTICRTDFENSIYVVQYMSKLRCPFSKQKQNKITTKLQQKQLTYFLLIIFLLFLSLVCM